MNKFEELYEEILTEMPYLYDIGQHIPNNHGVFDLQFEEIHSRRELIRNFYNLFFRNGSTVDKYGNSIEVKTDIQRKALYNMLVHDSYALLFIKKIIGLTDETPEHWLQRLISHYKRKPVSEGMQVKIPRIVTLYRKQDGSTVQIKKVRAYSDKQAKGFFIQYLKKNKPEYLNVDLFGIMAKAEDHDPESRWDWD